MRGFSVAPHESESSVLSAAARMNVTRDEAQARARLLDVDVVRRRARPHERRRDLRLDDHGAVPLHRAGREHLRRPGRRRRSTRSPSTAGRSTRRRSTTARGSRSTDLAADNELPSCARAAATCTPARGCTASSTRSTSPSTSTRSSRSPTRAGCSPSSSSPTSRRPSPSPSRRPPTGRSSPTSRRPSPSRSAWATRPGAFAADRAASRRTSPRWSPARTTGSTASTATATGSSRSALYCRASLAAHLDTDVILEETRQGFEFFERGLRHALPVREVRPAVRAGVQLGRDGERRLRDAQRGLRLPVAGAARCPTSGVR